MSNEQLQNYLKIDDNEDYALSELEFLVSQTLKILQHSTGQTETRDFVVLSSTLATITSFKYTNVSPKAKKSIKAKVFEKDIQIKGLVLNQILEKTSLYLDQLEKIGFEQGQHRITQGLISTLTDELKMAFEPVPQSKESTRMARFFRRSRNYWNGVRAGIAANFITPFVLALLIFLWSILVNTNYSDPIGLPQFVSDAFGLEEPSIQQNVVPDSVPSASNIAPSQQEID